MHKDITLCLTMGKRPDLLKRTLESLFQFHQFEHIIAINDFGDEATNQAFREVCPHGHLVNLGQQVGHHPAVDAMYALIKTPYVFHCEDDWLFTDSPNLEDSMTLLESPEISAVCYRKIIDFQFDSEMSAKIQTKYFNNIEYILLGQLHEQWYGYTFNPHLAKIDLWRNAGSFSKFKKERHISRWQRGLNREVAFISPGMCEHIGDNVSVANPKGNGSFLRQIKHLKKQIKSKLFK